MAHQIKIFTDKSEEHINEWLQESQVKVVSISRSMIVERYDYNPNRIMQQYVETIIAYEEVYFL